MWWTWKFMVVLSKGKIDAHAATRAEALGSRFGVSG